VAIQGIIWDMGGVILRTEDYAFRSAWERRLGLEPGELSSLVFEGKESRLASIGVGTVEAIWGALADRFELTPAERRQLELDFWRGDSVDRQLVEFIRRLHDHYRTALLSNAWPNVRHQIEGEWAIADAFDTLVISAEVGWVKPDPKIYQHALRQLGLPPQACVFIDDFEVNVEGARQLGIHGILFESSSQVRDDLERLLAG
jgi:epoxide hydrolase-like predicted phosphatase